MSWVTFMKGPGWGLATPGVSGNIISLPPRLLPLEEDRTPELGPALEDGSPRPWLCSPLVSSSRPTVS